MSVYNIYGNEKILANTESFIVKAQHFTWNGQQVAVVGQGGGVSTLGPVSGPGNANAGNISGSTLTLAPCDVDHPGVLVSGEQYFPAGTKHFQANVTLPTTSSGGTSGVLSIGTTQIHNYSQYPSVKNFFAGDGAGNFTLSGSYNTCIGTEAGSNLTSGGSNLVIGHGTSSLTTGQFNNFQGGGANITTGSRNFIAGGQAPGSHYMDVESDNICISNSGTAGDQGIIRIGDNSKHNNIFIGGVEGVSSLPDDGRHLLLAGETAFGVNGTKIQAIGPQDFIAQYGFTPYHTDHSILLNSRSVSVASFSGSDNVVLRTGTQPIPLTTGSNNIVIGTNTAYLMPATATNCIFIGANDCNGDADGTIRIGYDDTGPYTALYLAGVDTDQPIPTTGPSNKQVMWIDYSDGNGKVKSCTLSQLKAALAATP